jgi:hypothetical protein
VSAATTSPAYEALDQPANLRHYPRQLQVIWPVAAADTATNHSAPSGCASPYQTTDRWEYQGEL